MVYSRTKEREISPEQLNFCKNQVCLNSIGQYDSCKYSLFKNFEFKSAQRECQQLEFDSRFQSGNLQWAFKKKEQNSYVLFIQNDTNTYGYNQWFYFSIRNMKPKTDYHFEIVNFKKRHSFFREGKQLAVFSLKESQSTQNGWFYEGHNINYGRSPVSSQSIKYYALSYDLQCRHQDDLVMVAMNFPYSYSKMIHNLRLIQDRLRMKDKISWQMRAIAYSLSNNAVPYLSITSTKQKQKKVILMLARQHPGQTWSSYLMEQFLIQITSDSVQSEWLRDNFVFKVFPMVNVDGVIYGNFRCDLGGVDLNRNWKYPSKVLHPQIYAIREQIDFLNENYQIVSCFDMHGHSKQYNTFCYSCKTDDLSCRVLPYMLSRINEGFHFPYCTFGISKYKQSTARAVIFNTIKNPNVLTVECSFYGQKVDSQVGVKAYEPNVMNGIALTLIEGMSQYYSTQSQTRSQIEKLIKKQLPTLIEQELNNGDEAGSESDPSGDQIEFTEKVGKILPKTIITLVQQSSEKYKKKSKLAKGNTYVSTAGNKTNKKVKAQSIPLRSPINDETNQVPVRDKVNVERRNSMGPKKNAEQKNDNPKVAEKTEPQVKIVKKGSLPIKPRSMSKTIERRQGITTQMKIEAVAQNHKSFNNKSHLEKWRNSSKLMPLAFKNESEQLYRDNTGDSDFLNRTLDTSQKATTSYDTKMFVIRSEKMNKEQQFPQLCVLSESKKKDYLHLPKKSRQNKEEKQRHIRQIRPIITSKNSSQLPSTKRVEMYRRMKQKEKTNSELLSKIWIQNMSKYGKKLNIFMGRRGQDFL